MGIALRIALSAALLTLATVLVTGVISYRFTYSHILEDTKAPLERDVSYSAQQLEHSLDSMSAEVALLSKNLMIVNALIDSAGRELYILPFLKSYRLREDIPFVLTLYDFEGKPLASNAAMKSGLFRDKELFDRIFVRTLPYAKIRAGKDVLKLFIAYPVIYGATGKPEGFLAIETDLREIIKRSVSIREDSRSNVLISQGKDIVWSRLHAPPGMLMKASGRLSPKAPLDDLSLSLEIGESVQEATAPLRDLTDMYIRIGASILAFTLLFSYVMARQLTKRLISLSNSAELITERGLAEVKIDVRGTDEVARLAASFHSMLRSLKDYQDQLEQRVAERTSALSQSNDLLQKSNNSLAEAKEEWERTFNSMTDPIMILDISHRIVKANEAMAGKLGVTTSGAVGMICYEHVHGTSAPPLICPHSLMLSDGQEHSIEVYEERLGGHFIVTVTPLHNAEGLLIGSVHTAKDITDRKQAEETIRKNLDIMEKIFETTHFSIAYLDRAFNFIRVNKAYADSCGHPPEYFSRKNHFSLYPHEENEKIFQRVVETGDSFTIKAKPFEFPDHPEWGVTYWDWTLHPLKDADGNVESLLFVLLDVTERKRDEDKIKLSMSLQKATLESTADGILVVAGDGRITDFNNQFSRLWGIPKSILELHDDGKAMAYVLDQLKHPDNFITKIRELYAEPGATSFDVLEFKDGRVFERYSQPQKVDGKPVGRVWSFRDITEHKKAVLALRASEEKFRAITTTAADAILLMDDKGCIIYWNPSAERIFNYPAKEAIGRNLHQLIAPVRYHEAYCRGFADFTKTGLGPVVNRTVELIAKKKDGTEFPMEISTSALNLGGHWHALGIIRDVTERKQTEEQIRRSLKEKEVLLKEIHHRVKNNMQVVSSLLMLQAKHIKDDTVRAIFNESRNRIHSMSLIHEKLYCSEDLAHIDFSEYVGVLIKELGNIYNRPDIVISLNMRGIFLDINTGIPCGLIINELVSNSLKHAFPAGARGALSVSLFKDMTGQYVLTVKDDGKGLPPGLDFRNTATLGMQLVTTLAAQLNGTIELSIGRGTSIMITFAVPEREAGV